MRTLLRLGLPHNLQEGIEAKRAGVALNAFGLEEFKVPYGYSPLLVAHPDTVRWAAGGSVCGSVTPVLPYGRSPLLVAHPDTVTCEGQACRGTAGAEALRHHTVEHSPTYASSCSNLYRLPTVCILRAA